MIKIKQATADQIIGVDPNVYRHRDEEIDWQSMEKAANRIKEDMCYMKNNGIYREASFPAVRAQIYNWSKRGLIQVYHARWVKARKGATLVNPSEVRAMFLSHHKWDLKVNQPDYDRAMQISRRGKRRAKKTPWVALLHKAREARKYLRELIAGR